MLSNIVKYFRPQSIEEAVDILHRYSGEAKVIGGGSKFVRAPSTTRYLVDLAALNLTVIDRNERDEISLGATLTLLGLETSPLLTDLAPGLIQAVRDFGVLQLKSLATVAGTLLSPFSQRELAPVFEALSTQAVLRGRENRVVALADLLREGLRPGEILCQLKFPLWKEDRFAFRRAPGAGGINCAIRLAFEGKICRRARFALGHLQDQPRALAADLESLFLERDLSAGGGAEPLARARERFADIAMPAPLGLDPIYGRELVFTLFERALQDCLAGGPN